MPSSKNGGQINFGVGFETDQTSLNKLKKSLQDLQKIRLGDFKGSAKDLDQMKQTAQKVQIALEKAFNPTLNTTNISTFQSELQKTVGSVDQVYNKLKLAGPQGQVAFHQMATEILTTNLKLKQTNSLIDSMGKTMVNTVKWGIASSIMNTFTQSVQGAFQYVQSLEKSLTNIRIVTGDSTEKMAQFAEQANKSAQALGRSTLDYTKASLTFYQQGLNDEDVQTRTEATLKAQNITGAGSQMADYLTSVWNGYKVANEEAELYVDKLAAVADSSASDMSQLAIAMSKVASTANTMGVDIDQLNAQIATVVATTRQAPESVGTAFKTIYTRMNDIKTGSDEAEISLGRYSGIMAELGFNVLDATGHLRDTGQVMEEIGGRWQDLTKEQQIYLAQTMGGQRQVNQLMALFDNWTTYSELLNTSLESEGTLAEKNSRYMESLGAKMEQLGAAGERVKDALINENELKGGIQALTNLVNLMGNFIESIGGGSTALLAFGALATQVFQDTIARQINNVITNIQNRKNNDAILKADAENTIDFGESQGYKEGVINNLVDRKQAIQQYYDIMSEGEVNAYNNIIKTVAAAQQESAVLEKRKEVAESFYNSFGKNSGYDPLNKDNFEDINTALGTAVQDLQVLNDQVQDLSKKEIKPDSKEFLNTLELAKEKIQELFKGSEIQLAGWQPFIDKLKELQSQSNVTEQDLNKIKNAFGTVVKQASYTAGEAGLLPQISQQAEMAEAKLRAATKESENFQKQIQQLASVRTFTQTVAGIGQLTAGFKSLVNLTKVWKNENLSAGEKVLQTITNLSMSLPMLINGYSKMTSGVKDFVLGIKMQILATEADTKAIYEKALAQKYSETGNYAEAVSAGKAAVAQEAHAISLNKVIAKLYASYGAALPYIAILGLLAGAIYLAYKEWNKEADAAKKASEVAADTKKTYDDLKTSLQDVKSALDDLHAAEDNLDGLTKGTQEWRDALQQCNDKVLELISNYPELAQYVSNENGQLKLDAEGEQAYLDQLQAGVQNARNASYIASSNSREAAALASAANIGHNSSYGNGTAGQGGGFASSEDVLKVVGSLDKILEDGTSDLSNGLVSLSDEIAEETGLVEQEVSAILANEDAVLQLKTQLEQNANADKLMYEAMAANALQNNSTYKSMDDYGKQVVNAMAGSDLDAEIQRIEKELIDTMTIGVNKWSGASNSQVQSILEQLNEAQGTNWKLDSNAVRGTDTNRAFAFLDQAGQLHTYTKQQIASTIAAKQALQNLGTSAETAAQMLKHIDTSGISGSAQEAVKQWISGQDMSATTRTGLEELKGQNIQNLLGKQGAQALAEQWNLLKEDGTADIEALNERWHSSCDDMSSAFDNVAKDASRTVQTAFDSLKNNDNVKQATLGTQQEMVSAIQEAFNKNGKAGLDQLLNVYNSLKDIKPEDGISALDGFSKVIKDFDFNTGSVEDFKNALKEAGIETDASTQAIQAYINAQKEVSGLSPEENYKSVHDITDKLKRNDTIDAEQAATLEAAGVNLKAFFTLTADGSYKLKTNAETFQQYINNITIQPFKAKMDQLQSKIDSIHSFDEGGQFAKYSSQNMGIDEFSSAAGTITEIAGTNAQAVTGQDTEKLQAQIQFLKMIGVQDAAIRQAEVDIDKGRTTSAENLQRISQLIKDNSEQYQNLSEVEKRHLEQMQETRQQIADALDTGLDEDVDEEKWEKLSEHLQEYADQIPEVSDELKDNAEAADDVAQAILRYDSAIGQVQKNYNDWLQALTSGSIEDQVQATKDLENVYSDLLDLPFDNILSADFLQNVDNLNLLKQAANGSEQAYNQLAQAAAQDIAINAGMDTSDFEAGKDLIQSYTQDGVAFDDIEVGAFLDDANFIQGLNEMINATDMSVQQATDLLASMGVDAQVEAVKVPEQDKQQFINATPSVDYEDVAAPISVLDGLGNVTWDESNTVKVPHINYDLKPTQETADKESTATVLRVKSARKASGGGFKYKNSSAGNKGGGGSGKGGKGGKGGGGGKAKEPNKAKGATNKADRYRNNTVKANKLANSMTKLQKQQERLTGKDSLKNLQKQLQILKKQNDTIRERIGLQRDEQKQLANNLKKFGATFDKDGTLNNYFKVHAKIMQQYNNQVAKWNKMSAEQQQKNKDMLNNAKEVMDNALKDLQRYDKLQQDIAKSIQQQIDNAQEQIDNQVKQFEIKIQAELDLTKARREWNKFQKDIIQQIRDDDIINQNRFRFRDLISFYNENKTGSIQQLTDRLKELAGSPDGNGIFSANYLNETLKNMTLTDRQARIEEIQKIFKNLTDQMEEFKQIADEIEQSIFDTIDATQDAFDEQMDEYEYIRDLLDHNQKITEKLFGDQAYNQMAKYYDQVEKNNNKQLEFLSSEKDLWYGLMDEERQRMQNIANTQGIDSNEYKKVEERFKEYEKHWMDSVKNLNSAVEDALDNIIDKYDNTINGILLNLELKLGNGNRFEDIEDEWDRINDQADMFLDKINSAYEIDKLQNVYQDAIKDNDGDIAAQQALNDLMEQQLAYLKDKDKLTQYDVDRANTLLQIEMKRLALEQSRANKNRLRLRRDSQGNYTYQYTADTEAINKAEQELADARISLYNSDKAAYVDNLSSIQKSAENIKSRLEDIWKDQNLGEEQKLKKSYELQKYYGDMINDLLTENASIRNNLIDSAFEDIEKDRGISRKAFDQLSKAEQDNLLSMYVPQINSATAQLVDNLFGEGGVKGLFEDFLEGAKQAGQSKMNSISLLEESQRAGLIKDYETLTEQAKGLLDDNDALIDKYGQELTAVQNTISALNNLISKYESASKAAAEAAQQGFKVLQLNNMSTLGFSSGAEDLARENSEKNFNDWINLPDSGSDIPGYVPYKSEWSGTAYASLFGSTDINEADYLFGKNKTNDYLDLENHNNINIQAVQKAIDDSLTNNIIGSLNNNIFVSINNTLNDILKDNQQYHTKSLINQEDITKAIIANQTIHIDADFPNAKDISNILQAIDTLTAVAAQKAGTVQGKSSGSKKK